MVEHEMAPNNGETTTVEVERRSLERLASGRKSLIRLLARPSFQTLTAVLQDVTPGGLGLILGSKLEPGTILALQIQGRRQGTSSIVSARVMHATPRPDGNWHIGCKFSARLKDEDEQALLEMGSVSAAGATQAHVGDRRAWVRYHCSPDAPCQAVDTRPDIGIYTAVVRDISNSGVSLILNRHVKVGAFLAVELVSANQTSLPPLLVRVVHATAQLDGDWLIGCEFATELTEDELDNLLTK